MHKHTAMIAFGTCAGVSKLSSACLMERGDICTLTADGAPVAYSVALHHGHSILHSVQLAA
jgi:hypothetical protein